MVNKVILVGRAGRDPEQRTFSSGDGVVSFSLATDESWRDKSSGERKTRTTWHNIQIFNEHIGKIASQYVRKGSKVYVEGTIQIRDYTDKDGNQKQAFEIVLPKFSGALELLDTRKENDVDASKHLDSRKNDNSHARPSLKDQLSDDIPF